MRRESRLLMGLAAVLLVPVFWLPLWSIRISAPQYREGLGMNIGLRDIWGHRPNDIQNINILNHYIGMKPIDPATVDVLTIMPWVVLFLMVSAVAAAALGRRRAVWGWLGAFVVLGTAGMAEFWRWNHDYGHNLSPEAPIKIPGMTYQPPILGSKQLLNIYTTSFPSWGTLFIALALLAGVAALVLDRRRTAPAPAPRRQPRALAAAAASVAALALLAGCGTRAADAAPAEAVPEFAAGAPCAYCDGAIPETRFGGELETRDGRTFRFMSAECLAGFVAEGRLPADQVAAVRVVDYSHGERLIDAADAHYVRMQWASSPSGLNVAAVSTEKVAGTLHYFFGGERMTWEQVVEMVAAEWALNGTA